MRHDRARIFVASISPTYLRFGLLKLRFGLRYARLGLLKLCLRTVQLGNERTRINYAQEISFIYNLTFRKVN